MSQVLEFALASDWRTPKDYFDHFGTRTVVEKLERDPPLRTRLLVETTGVHERLAKRKSPESATEDLDIALEQGLTTAQQLMALIPNDDRVRHLDPKEIWRFLTGEGDGGPGNDAVTVERVTFLLQAALECDVLSRRDIAHAIGLRRVSKCLPQAELQRIVEDSLSRAQQGHRLSEDEMLATIPLASLVKYLPLAHTWSAVVEGRLLANAGLQAAPHTESGPSAHASRPSPEPSRPPEDTMEGHGSELERQRVCDALEALGRLPSDNQQLGLPVLLSIESMYADLRHTHDEPRRRLAVRDAFPNESLLRSGLFSLLQMLDPNLDRAALESASTESLVDALLHGEQQITDAHQTDGNAPDAKH